jgi:hypothetical protein
MATKVQSKRQDISSITEESDLMCSRKLARELIGQLLRGVEPQTGDSRPFYIFSIEKRVVRIRLVRTPAPATTGS